MKKNLENYNYISIKVHLIILLVLTMNLFKISDS